MTMKQLLTPEGRDVLRNIAGKQGEWLVAELGFLDHAEGIEVSDETALKIAFGLPMDAELKGTLPKGAVATRPTPLISPNPLGEEFEQVLLSAPANIPFHLKGKEYRVFKHGSTYPKGEAAPIETLVPEGSVTEMPPLSKTRDGKPVLLVRYPSPDSVTQIVQLGECLDPSVPEETTQWHTTLRPVT